MIYVSFVDAKLARAKITYRLSRRLPRPHLSPDACYEMPAMPCFLLTPAMMSTRPRRPLR